MILDARPKRSAPALVRGVQYRPWTPEQDDVIRRHYPMGTQVRVIANALGRTTAEVYQRANHLGLARPRCRPLAPKHAKGQGGRPKAKAQRELDLRDVFSGPVEWTPGSPEWKAVAAVRRELGLPRRHPRDGQPLRRD